IAPDGSPAWSPASRPICLAANTQDGVSTAPDGSGGAYFAWSDLRRSIPNDPDVHVMRLLADGSRAPGWPANGRLAGVLTGAHALPSVLPDGEDGLWVMWQDMRPGVSNLYYTRIQGSGVSAPGFDFSGRPLSNNPGSRANAVAVPDGAGGFIAVWQECRNGV